MLNAFLFYIKCFKIDNPCLVLCAITLLIITFDYLILQTCQISLLNSSFFNLPKKLSNRLTSALYYGVAHFLSAPNTYRLQNSHSYMLSIYFTQAAFMHTCVYVNSYICTCLYNIYMFIYV